MARRDHSVSSSPSTRQFSTFDINIEYISTSQLPVGGLPAYRNSLRSSANPDLPPGSLENLSVNGHPGTPARRSPEPTHDHRRFSSHDSTGVYPPIPPRPKINNPTNANGIASSSRAGNMRPHSVQYVPGAQHQGWAAQPSAIDDPSTRPTRPMTIHEDTHTNGSQSNALLSNDSNISSSSSINGGDDASSSLGGIAGSTSGAIGLHRALARLHGRRSGTPTQSRHSFAGYQVHTNQPSVTHSEYLQSSHVQHGDTPVLSSAGSLSEDEDEDEIHSPTDFGEPMHAAAAAATARPQPGSQPRPSRQQHRHTVGTFQNGGYEAPATRREASEGGSSSYPSQEPLPELETQETLKRERTRILERIVVAMRQIDYSAITNIKPLKKGGYGEIHTAEWSRLKVVLKRALPENDEGVEQFDQELEILKRVHDYDFIVRFYGVTVDPSTNTKCMVMKHCINGNLCSFLEKNHETLTWLERYRLSIEIAKGLEFLHKSGFHHRDLHSGNILLDDKLTAMICDFGLSRSSARGKQSDAAATIGVSSFLAPERFPAQRPVYTSACDIYSLGVIFWHISSGRIPFQKRLHEPKLLSDLLEGLREDIVPGTPSEYRDLVVKCWDRKPAKRLKIDVVIAVLQTLMAKPSEPEHQISTGFFMPSETSSASLPVPPDLGARMSSLERAASELNRMVYEIQDPMVHETVRYIERTRAFFRDQTRPPEPYSRTNRPTTPIYLCPIVGDVAALNFHLSSRRSLHHNPINESSEKTGDTALHLACLFLASPMDTIKVLVELGADINLENRQGYTPVMILVTSNTQHCYDALKFFVMRGARIPAYIRNPITPLNSAQIHALNLVSESRQFELVAATAGGVGVGAVGGAAASSLLRVDRRPMPQQMHHRNGNGASFMEGQSGMMTSAISSRDAGRLLAQGRPLIHVVAAMQDDQKIIDCLCEAGLDPAVEFAGETALVAAAAHLRINNVKWLLWHDLDISSTEAGIQRAIKIVKMLHPSATSTGSSATPGGGGNDRLNVNNGHGGSSNGKHRKSASTPVSGRIWDHFMGSSSTRDKLENIRDLGKYSWAGMAIGDADDVSKDMARPVLHLLEEWTGSRRIELRKVVATQLKVMYGDSMGPSGSPYQQSLPVMRQQQQYAHPMAGSDASLSSSGSVNSIGRPEEGANMGDLSSYPQNGHHVSRETNGSHGHGNGNLHRQSHQQLGRGRNGGGTMSSRKNQRHLIDQALSEKPTLFWRAI